MRSSFTQRRALNPWALTTAGLLAVGLLTTLAACDDGQTAYSSATSADEDNDAGNNAPNNLDEPDAGDEPDVEEEEPDVGPPANGRTLGERALMGELPVNNHFGDPNFRQLDGRFWLYFDTLQFQFSPIAREIAAESPTGTPLISDDSRNVGGSSLLLGLARAPRGASYVSILVGNPSPLIESPVISIGLIGAGIDGRDGYYPLQLTDEPAFQSGGKRWWRMEAFIEEPLLGLVYLSVEGLRGGDYSLTGPTLVPATTMRSQRPRLDSISQSPARALKAVESTALKAARERLFHDPPNLDIAPRRGPNGEPF